MGQMPSKVGKRATLLRGIRAVRDSWSWSWNQDFSWFFSVLVLECLSWSYLGLFFGLGFLSYQKFLIDEMSLTKKRDISSKILKIFACGAENGLDLKVGFPKWSDSDERSSRA